MIREYTIGEKVQMVDALKAARTRIWNGVEGSVYSQPYVSICSALSNSPGADLVRKEIHHRLDGFFGVRSWLIHHGYLNDAERYGAYLSVQQYRLQWIDALIKEFSE